MANLDGLSEVDKAKHRLASAMMNQVGTTWEENCDSVDLFCQRMGKVSDLEMVNRLDAEAYRYEDM